MKSIPALSLLLGAVLTVPVQAENVRDVMGAILVDPPTPAAIEAKCDRYIAAVEARRNALLDADGAATLGNTLVPFDEASALLQAGVSEAGLYQQVMLTPELRDAGGACQVRLMSLDSELSLSRPIYDRLAALALDGEDAATQRYHADILAAFERAGVALDDAGRARVQEIQDELAALSTEFARNIAEDTRTVNARPEQLAGLPQDFLDAHPPGEDGLITLSTAYTDYQPVMTYAASDALRRELSEQYLQRGYPQNDAVLRRLFTLRSELAALLGRRNYAEVALEDKMLDTPEKVAALLEDTAAAARPVAERELAMNLEVLRQMDPEATGIQLWQRGYVANRARQSLYDYDPQEARRYFAYENVRDGVLALTEDLFGVEIRQWDTAVWHPDVEAYEMLDGGEVIGRFYFDNHPRPGKYTHANMIPLFPGVPGKHVPLGALVQNLPRGGHATGLMEHQQVETLLHEFGHMIHGIFANNQRWLRQGMGSLEWDAIEAPSQMLENWVYDYETLAAFAVDAQGNTIPRELVEKMNRVRYFNQGLGELQQLGYANVSLRFHTEPLPEDMGAATRAWTNTYALIPFPEYAQFQDAFGHLDGYSAFYYTYLWSRVIAADLFTRFEREGLRNAETAEAYRRLFLEASATRPAAAIIRDFLGRDVSLDAFRSTLEQGLE